MKSSTLAAAPDTGKRSNAARRRTAVHEAGHAIVSEVLGIGCAAVSIIPDYDAATAGYCLTPTGWGIVSVWDARGIWRSPGAELRTMVLQRLAGLAAERELIGRAHRGAFYDRRDAGWLIDDLTRSAIEGRRLFRRLELLTAMLVRRHRLAIAALADALLLHREMKGDTLADLLEQLLAASPVVKRHGAWARTEAAAEMVRNAA